MAVNTLYASILKNIYICDFQHTCIIFSLEKIFLMQEILKFFLMFFMLSFWAFSFFTFDGLYDNKNRNLMLKFHFQWHFKINDNEKKTISCNLRSTTPMSDWSLARICSKWKKCIQRKWIHCITYFLLTIRDVAFLLCLWSKNLRACSKCRRSGVRFPDCV